MKKIFILTAFLFTAFFGTNLSLNALECDSLCPDSCGPSHVVCKGYDCILYCGTSSSHNSDPGVSFNSTPNTNSSVTNEVYAYDLFYRPKKVINGFRQYIIDARRRMQSNNQ